MDQLETIPAVDSDRNQLNAKLNWLRAGVLGANDGVVATSSLVIGVAAAGANFGVLLTAALAGLSAGALSMAVGEYVSVSTQRDTESALIEDKRTALAAEPDAQLDVLARIYQGKGLSPELARTVAVELTEHNALEAHAEAALMLDHESLTNPWHAALASLLAFIGGSILPLLTILLIPGTAGILATLVAAAISLGLTGYVSARMGDADPKRAILRNVVGGLTAMAITYGIGAMVGRHLD